MSSTNPLIGAIALIMFASVCGFARSEPPKAEQKEVEIKGQVVDPDGKPVAGAKVFLVPFVGGEREYPQRDTVSSSDGKFVFRCEPDRNHNKTALRHAVTAFADGFGPVSFYQYANSSDIKVELVKDDQPIEGRIIDLEGRPVPGASIRVLKIGTNRAASLDAVVAAMRDGESLATDDASQLSWIALEEYGVKIFVKADSNGRFRLTGIGRERIAQLRVEGESTTTEGILAMTRPGVRPKGTRWGR